MARETETGEIEMERAAIAGTSLEVSRVALGTWAIGGWMWGVTEEAESIATIRAAVEHGINLIDTAPVYGFGRSEEIVGKALAEGHRRSRVRIATEPGIEADILPYCRKNKISTFGYGALCRGLLSGRMRPDSKFEGDDLRRTDPKFQQSRFGEYLAAVTRLDQLAQRRFHKRVIHLAVRWMLDQGITTALWGARHRDQLQPVDEVMGWRLAAPAKAEIDRILRETIRDPVGPEFMAPPARSIAARAKGCPR